MHVVTIEKDSVAELEGEGFILSKVESAQKRRESSLAFVRELRRVAGSPSHDLNAAKRIVAKAQLIAHCADPTNIAVISGNLAPDDHEQKAFFTSLWQCRQRECAMCANILSNRTRRAVHSAIGKAKTAAENNGWVEPEYQWHLITLTAPRLPGLDLYESLEVFERAWALLRKRRFWKDRVVAGVKALEFTFNRAHNSYKIHSHLLVLSLAIEKNRRQEAEAVAKLTDAKKEDRALKVGNLNDEWAICLRNAYEGGKDCTLRRVFPASRLVTDVRQVEDTDLEYVEGYICKSDSWLKLPAGELARLFLLEAPSPRMVEAFGLARSSSPKTKTEPDVKEPAPPKRRVARKTWDSDTPDSRATRDSLLDSLEHLNDALRDEILSAVGDMEFTNWLSWLKRQVRAHREFQIRRLKKKFKAKITLLAEYIVSLERARAA